ncbi:MAG: nucleotidyltransferase family protein [Cyanobacteria bacterium]|nr:nucleotidyltransferase family protein [Cyanobacteriota bacterium]MDA0866214.1 nucleotidyltransferase family protein [Cyanobacteriota bacterium]
MTIPSTNLPTSDLERNLQTVILQRESLIKLCQKHPIRKLSLFGSILRSDFTDHSDIDLLVEFLPNARIGYFELIRIENELTDLMGRKVDLRTPNELSHHFRQAVLKEAVTQYVKD